MSTKTLQRMLTQNLMDFLFCFLSLILVFKIYFFSPDQKVCEFLWGLCSSLPLEGHVFVLKQLPEASKARRHEAPSLRVFCILIAI